MLLQVRLVAKSELYGIVGAELWTGICKIMQIYVKYAKVKHSVEQQKHIKISTKSQTADGYY